MQTPLEIAFHGVLSSSALETDIRERFAKLDQLYPRITTCRVSIEALHHQPQTGNLYEVHIDLRVPGEKLVATRETQKPDRKHANPDLRAAVREAFRAAERQLKSFKARQRGEIKPLPEQVHGRVVELHPAQEYGYIQTLGGALLYFHRSSLLDGGFDRLQQGDPVQYVQADGQDGPTAVKVWRNGIAR